MSAADVARENRELHTLRAQRDRILRQVEGQYVRFINAILAAADESSVDANRWRGHAEAYRSMAEQIRLDNNMPKVSMTSQEWRDAHGVYTAAEVANFKRIAGAS